MRIAVVYATVEGQTRTIAEHIARHLRDGGHETEMIDATHPPDSISIDAIDAVICTAPVHMGKFPAAFRRFVHRHTRELMARPGAFVTVSLTAAGKDPKEMEELAEIVSAFSEETGWWPVSVHNAAGALKYTEYDYFRRWIMRRIANDHGFSTDTKHDHEFTDWSALDEHVDGFLRDVPAVAGKV